MYSFSLQNMSDNRSPTLSISETVYVLLKALWVFLSSIPHYSVSFSGFFQWPSKSECAVRCCDLPGSNVTTSLLTSILVGSCLKLLSTIFITSWLKMIGRQLHNAQEPLPDLKSSSVKSRAAASYIPFCSYGHKTPSKTLSTLESLSNQSLH